MVAAVTAASNPYPLAGRRGELLHHGRRDYLLPRTFENGAWVADILGVLVRIAGRASLAAR
jgi:hypothetical protein